MTAMELIDMTARTIIAELKKSGMIRENRLNSFKKTEKVLYEYPFWKAGENNENGSTSKFINIIERSLKRIEDDPYYELIELRYFKCWTHERIAEYFDVDEKTIRYQRQKLIERLRPIIFSDEYIKELVFDL